VRAQLVVVALAAGATLGGAIGSSASTTPKRRAPACRPRPRHDCPQPRKRCRPHPHHGCPVVKRKPRPTTTSTTTTTTTTTALPSRLEVDENDQGQLPLPYSMRPSHDPVAAGRVQFNVYNFGQDAHTFAIVDPTGHELTSVDLPAGAPQTAVQVTANLARGQYTLECTLPGHAKLGMIATLTVK
jgi:uncharacterized cupredoxin-like copper-binding protein